MDVRTVPFSAIFDLDDTPDWWNGQTRQGIIESSDVIAGRDVRTEEIAFFYGKEIFRTRKGSSMIKGIIVELDFDSDEPDRLCAIIQDVKGWHEFER